MATKKHYVTVRPHETALGTRWRWDCETCPSGAYGYTSREAAQEYADEHPERAAAREEMWAAAGERMSSSD